MSTESFIAIGDTVPSVDPVWGQGIYKCMKSARAAAMTADRCLTGNIGASSDEMAIYDDLWNEQVAPRQNRRLAMTKLLYLAPNERYDRLMRDLNRLSRDTLSKANSGNKMGVCELLHFQDLPLLWKYCQQNIRERFRRI